MSETGGVELQPEPEGGETPESVRAALASYVPLSPGQVFPVSPDGAAVQDLVASCRKSAPDATEDEIVHFIHEKGAIAKRNRVSDPVSYLLTSVPEAFAGGDISRYRAELKEKAARAETAKKKAEEGWICPQCNVVVTAPLLSDKKKRVCPQGHQVEKRVGFFGGLIGIILFAVLAALASHVVGWIWNIPARLLNAFTVGLMPIGPVYFFIKGVRNLFRGSPARGLAAGQFGSMLGSLLIVILIFYSMGAAASGGANGSADSQKRQGLSSGAETVADRPGDTQFSATVIWSSPVRPAQKAQIHVRKNLTRVDIAVGPSQPSVYLVIDKDKQTIAVVAPGQPTERESTATGTGVWADFYRKQPAIFGVGEPCAAAFPVATSCKYTGQGVLGGRTVAIWEGILAIDGRILTGHIWVDSRLGRIIKVESPGGSIELQDVQEVSQPIELFTNPTGYATRPDGQPGATFNPTCFTPDKPYYTDSSWERVYRFFLPYGMMFGSGCE
jgi:hypothetical protein